MTNDDLVPKDDDRDPFNVIARASYLLGMAMKYPDNSDDKVFLLKAHRSLYAYAVLLDKETT